MGTASGAQMYRRTNPAITATQRIGTFGLALVAFLSLSACAGVHLYNEENNTTATDLKNKKAEIDFEKVFSAERENLRLLLAHEISIRDRFIEQVRERVIWKFAYKRQTFDAALRPLDDNYVEDRLERLGIGGNVSLYDAASAYASLDRYVETRGAKPKRGSAARLVMVVALDELRDPDGLDWKEPYTCAEAISKSVDEAVTDSNVEPAFLGSFRLQYVNYVALCRQEALDVGLVVHVLGKVPQGSLLKESTSEFETALAELKKLEGQIQATKNSLPREKDKKETAEDFLAKLQKSANTTAETLGVAAEASKVLGFEKVLTEERIDAVSFILRAFGGGALPDLSDAEKGELKKRPGLHRAAIIAAGLPGLAGDIKNLKALMSDPGGRAGLAIQLGYLQLKLKHLNRRTELVRQRAQLAADQLRAHLQEAHFFRNAGRAMDAAENALKKAKDEALRAATASKGGPLDSDEKVAALKSAKLGFANVGGLTYAEVQALPKSKVKRRAIEGLLAFDMATSVARRRADALSFRLIDARHQEINEADAFAARAWNNLLDGPIQQIQAYHASGIKTEEIAEIVSGLAGLGLLGFIGVKEAN